MSREEKDQREERLIGEIKEAEELDPDDLFGLNDDIETIDFQCIECGCIDPVPDFVVDECSFGLEEGEEVEMYCPKCNGTMRRAKEKAEDPS